jgi:hypothetical protein
MTKLQKKLKVLNSVYCCSFEIIRPIVDMMDSIIVVESKWHEKFKQDHPEIYPLDLSKMKTWSTYQECVSLEFHYINSRFIGCEAVIWNGDMLNGYKKDIRFTATLKIPSRFISKIKENIEYALDDYCESRYEEYLRKLKREWVSEFKTSILK